jgi:hypothetical protein
MSNKVVSVENLSKCDLIRHDEQHTTFREMLMREARNFARKY